MLRKRAKQMMAIVLFGVSVFSVSHADSTGTIHFTGALVESACKVSVQGGGLISSCVRESRHSDRKDSFASGGNGTYSLPGWVGKVDVEWLESSRHLGRLTVVYY